MQIKLIFTRKVLHLALEILEQLFDEVEHDIMNYQNLVSVLSASAFGFGR